MTTSWSRAIATRTGDKRPVSTKRKQPHHIDVPENREQANARVAGDVAAGRRCPQCHLVLPCMHEQITDAASNRGHFYVITVGTAFV